MNAQSDDLAANYARGEFDGSLPRPRRPAVLAVDMVRAYVEVSSPLCADVRAAVANARILLDAARTHGLPIVHTRVAYGPGGADGGLFRRKVPALRVFEAGGPLGEFIEEVRPRRGEVVVTKQYASAFFGTSLASTLTALGVDGVLICGLTTSGCVRATAVDALQHGLAPYVVRDAVGDRHPDPHEANLFDLQAKYAEVVSLDAARELLAREAP